MREIYLDNHATTRVDSRVIEAMLPWMNDEFANAGSHTHGAGRRAAATVEQCTERILGLLGAPNHELVYTSGATESINLAIFGTFSHPKQTRRGLLVGLADHRAVLDCAKRLKTLECSGPKLSGQKLGDQSYSVDYIKVKDATSQQAGAIDLEAFQEALSDNVSMVSVILGNNEIGTLQNIEPLAQACRNVGALLHIDATQAIGKIDFRAADTQADFISFSAHKFYGPKGIGGLLVPKDKLRLRPQIIGGGQQNNLRSGTLNTPGIAGMCRALEVATEDLPIEAQRLRILRNRLWDRLFESIEGLGLNGPPIEARAIQTAQSPARSCENRLPGNLNVRFPKVEGQSLMLKVPQLALSSGSACSSSDPRPSHVLQAIGLNDEEARSSLRFGIGRFNTEEEIDEAADRIVAAYNELRLFVA